MTSPSVDLHSLLAAENALIQQFVTLLEEERSILADGRIEELPALVEKKEKFAADLNALSGQRGDALIALGHTADRAGMAAWKAGNPDQQAQITWEKTLSFATKAQELNRVNNELLQIHLQQSNNALAILLRTEAPLDLYGPDGRPAAQGGRKIDNTI